MKKTYSESELKEKAQEVFSQFPNAKEVYATSDGNVFVMKNRAQLHAGKGNVLKIDRPFETTEEEDTFSLDKLTKAELVDFAKVNNIGLGELTVKSNKKQLFDVVSKAFETLVDEIPVVETPVEEITPVLGTTEETPVEGTSTDKTQE